MRGISKKERVSVTLDAEVLNKIEEGRGLIPRAVFINEILKNALGTRGGLDKVRSKRAGGE